MENRTIPIIIMMEIAASMSLPVNCLMMNDYNAATHAKIGSLMRFSLLKMSLKESGFLA